MQVYEFACFFNSSKLFDILESTVYGKRGNKTFTKGTVDRSAVFVVVVQTSSFVVVICCEISTWGSYTWGKNERHVQISFYWVLTVYPKIDVIQQDIFRSLNRVPAIVLYVCCNGELWRASTNTFLPFHKIAKCILHVRRSARSI